jgi:CheY-like chemotaxis protein
VNRNESTIAILTCDFTRGASLAGFRTVIWHARCLAICNRHSTRRRCVKTPQYFANECFSAMHVLIASSSAYRRELYQQAIHSLGHDVSLADGGVDCIEQVRVRRPDLLVLEAPLHWGGCDGVLDMLQGRNSFRLRVILVAAGTGSIDWFQLSRFRVDDVLFRLPTLQELQRAIGDAARNATTRPVEADQQIA